MSPGLSASGGDIARHRRGTTAIDRAVKDTWRFDPVAAQRGHKGWRCPANTEPGKDRLLLLRQWELRLPARPPRITGRNSREVACAFLAPAYEAASQGLPRRVARPPSWCAGLAMLPRRAKGRALSPSIDALSAA